MKAVKWPFIKTKNQGHNIGMDNRLTKVKNTVATPVSKNFSFS